MTIYEKVTIYIFFTSLTLLSCDGRNRKHKTNAEVLKENKLFKSFSKEIKYIPEQQTKIFTDTVLSSGFQIKLQYYSLDNEYATKTIKATNKTLHYKNFEARFAVYNDNKLVSNQIVNKKLFSNFESTDFWRKAIMQFVWIDYENSTENFLVLNTSFNIPETEVYKDFRIIVDATGNIKIKQTNLVESVI